MTDSSREAQAEIRNAIAKSEMAYAAKRMIMSTNLTSATHDASRAVRSVGTLGSYHLQATDSTTTREFKAAM
jgi:hypothetical protein